MCRLWICLFLFFFVFVHRWVRRIGCWCFYDAMAIIMCCELLLYLFFPFFASELLSSCIIDSTLSLSMILIECKLHLPIKTDKKLLSTEWERKTINKFLDPVVVVLLFCFGTTTNGQSTRREYSHRKKWQRSELWKKIIIKWTDENNEEHHQTGNNNKMKRKLFKNHFEMKKSGSYTGHDYMVNSFIAAAAVYIRIQRVMHLECLNFFPAELF